MYVKFRHVNFQKTISMRPQWNDVNCCLYFTILELFWENICVIMLQNTNLPVFWNAEIMI